jgi:UTP--glucose-1-phosphate uridylyltransferase
VLCAQPVLNDEPFAVILADDLIDAETPVMRQMVQLFEQDRCSVLGVQEIPPDQTASYGIVATDPVRDRVALIKGIVEKPRPADAPSSLAVIGRYVLTPAILEHLARIPPGSGGELQLTDAIASLLARERVLAYRFDGVRYDCGSKLGYLQATVAYGARHRETGAAFGEFLRQFTAR